MRTIRWKAAGLCAGLAALAVSGWAAEKDAAWVDQRIGQWQPTEREKRWEGIGWAPDLRTAQNLAKESRRPVFMFTLDGKMGVGRC